MDDLRSRRAIAGVESLLQEYHDALSAYTSGIRSDVRSECMLVRDEVAVTLSRSEIILTRSVTVLIQNAEYRIMRAYYYASPSLIAILLAIYGVVQIVIQAITMINSLITVATGQNLIYWVDKLIPGFQAAWNKIMNQISSFSKALGWGVDGVGHLINVVGSSSKVAGLMLGKDPEWLKVKKIDQVKELTDKFGAELNQWEKNPGQMIAGFAERWEGHSFSEASYNFRLYSDKVAAWGDKAAEAFRGVGDISDELLALRNDMPSFIAKNIPRVIWDTLEKVDSAVNDRILPFLQTVTDRLGEVDAVLEAHRKKAELLAERLAHPGDMLAEIESLPGYARSDQLAKIDGVTSTLMRERNEAAYKDLEGDLREFALVTEALRRAPPAPGFLELELPGRAPGIVAEPYETWFVGDY